MALIKCEECGKEISDKAVSCPNCGNMLKKDTYNKEISAAKKVAIFIIAVLAIITVYYFITGYFIPAHTYISIKNGEIVEEFRLFK